MFLMLLMTLFGMSVQAQQRNVLQIPDLTTQTGNVQLPVSIENTDEIVGAQFDLTLPEGVTAESVGRLANRSDGHTVTISRLSGGAYRVLLHSSQNRPLRGQSGVVMYLSITIPATFEEESQHTLSITNAVLGKATGDNVITGTEVGSISISKLPDLTVNNITCDTQTLNPGDRIVASWQVENIGEQATGGGWSEQISLVSVDGSQSKLIATTYYDNTLDAGGIVSRQVEVSLPLLLGVEGEMKLQVCIKPNNDTGESISAHTNNTSQSDNVCTVQKRLFIEPVVTTVAENSGQNIAVKISRSGNWESGQIITLGVSEDNRVTLPDEIMIPAGESGAIVYMTVQDNDVLDDNNSIVITAKGNSYSDATGTLTIEDDECPNLTLATSKSVLTEGDVFQMTVTTSRISATPIDVTLTSEDSKHFSYPQKVTIAAGETSATVDVAVIDDEVPNLDLSNAFTASAPKHNKAEIIVILKDNDLPVLELQLTPTTVQESAGVVSVAGVLRRTSNTNNKITVKLSDDADGGLYFGNRTLVLDKGVEEVHFNFGPVDNAMVNGDRTYTITAAVWMSSCSCNASGESAGSVQAQLKVLDDDGPALHLTSSLGTMKEGGKTMLTVNRNTADTSSPLTVKLNSDYDEGLTYNPTVTIPSGQTSAEVEIASKANDEQGDSHTVVFTVTSDGYASGTCYIMVTDQTLPDARIGNILATALDGSSIESVEVGSKVKLAVEIVNDGVVDLPAEALVKIYRRGEPNAVGSIYTSEVIAVGRSQTITKTITLPTNVGDHNYYAVVNESNSIQELTYNNNTSQDLLISTTSPFSVAISTDKAIYKQGDKVIITGQLTGNNIANANVDIYVMNEGARQVQTVTTDEKGAFTYEWQLYALQSGHFVVGACYPGEKTNEEMAVFDVYGLRRTSKDFITCETKLGEPYSGGIELINTGNLNLTNVYVEVLEKPEYITASFSNIDKMEGGSTKMLSFTLNSDELSPVNEWEKIKVRIASNEGSTITETIYYHNVSPRAGLKTDIAQIKTTTTLHDSFDYTFYITNTGKGSTGTITLGLPSWMKTVTAASINSLEYGQSTRVMLRFEPSDQMQLNVPLTGHISINCENGDGIILPYEVKPVSESTGKMVVDVSDEYTLLTEEKPHVQNAHVIVSQPITGEKVAEGETDENGVFFTELPAGYYNVAVKAERHDSYTNSIMVAPGIETNVDVFLSFQAITYSWDVLETNVEDEYEVKTTVKYETRVPKPVVVVNYPEELPYKSQVVNILVTNKGLVSAFNIDLDSQLERDGTTIEPLISLPIDTLAPQTSVAIPVLMTVKGDEIYESHGGVDYGGTYYEGGGGKSEGNPNVNHVKKKSVDIDEVSPGCWRLEFTVSHDLRVCNKQTGEWEPVGREYSTHTRYYGHCGSGGGTSGWGGVWLPSWIPVWSPDRESQPNPPCNPPADNRRHEEDDNNQRTQIFDGCTTNCEDSAIKLPASCAAAAGGCIPDPTMTVWAASCITGMGAGCSGVDDLWDAADCVLAGVGCIPGPIGCAAGAVGCLSSLGHVFVDCYMNRPNRNSMRYMDISKSKVVSKDSYERLFIAYSADSIAIEKLYYVLGDGNWENVKGSDFEMIRNYLFDNMNHEGVKLSNSRFKYKPESISDNQFDNFLKRLDRSIKKYNDPSLEYSDVIDIGRIKQLEEEFAQFDAEAVAEGYSGIQELTDSVCSYYRHLIKLGEEGGSNSVCATISLQFKQTMVMTRQAFRGILKVRNGHPTESMTDVKLNLEIKKTNGNIATAHEFQINTESLDGFNGEISLDEGWTLAGDANGTATLLFIPTKYAAPDEPVDWSFGGTLSYIDPFTGLEVTRELYPVTLTVKPSPELDLTYFMQRDVFGDDPLTETVEPIVPSEFALLINNKGNGDATNVRMVTQQPEIIENEKGLFIDFELVSSQMNGSDATLSFGKSIANDFGTIPAHSQMYAQWWLNSTLLGHFTEYDVKATHVTSYGNEDLSLLDKVEIHELNHGFTVKHDGEVPVRGFLVNDIVDAQDMPDNVYFTDATQQDAYIATGANIEKQSDTEYMLTVQVSDAGWNYGSLLDPTFGKQKLVKVTRSDGTEVNVDNIWQTDRTLRDGKDWLYENRLHFIGNMSAEGETFHLTFEPKPEVELQVEGYSGIPEEGTVQKEQLTEVTVKFNKPIKAETFTTEDITLNCQGIAQDASQIVIEPLNEQEYKLKLNEVTLLDGYYVLTVQTAGIEDTEGFNGSTGKQATWIQFVDGKVALKITASPKEGGTVSTESGLFGYGSEMILNATPSEGYEFVGWYNNGEAVSSQAEFIHFVNMNTELTAKFVAKNYLVTFYDDDRTTVLKQAIQNYGSEIIPPETPAKEGHTFVGWGEVDQTVPAHEVEYYAKYNVNKYKVTYIIDDQEYAVDSVAYGESIPIIEAPIRNGYEFNNWGNVPNFMPAYDLTLIGSYTLICNQGDVNNDGIIVVDDVVLTINAVMGHDSDNFVFEAADMNGDGQILVDDVVLVIKAVLNSDNSNVAKVRGTVSGEEIALNANGNGFGMSVSNASAYSALQFDMVIPAGVNMDEIRVKQGDNHMVFFQKKSKGVVRAVVISLTNEPFTGNDLLDVKIETADEEVVLVTNACMVTRNGSVSQLADASVAVGGNYTDISEVLNGTEKADIYDLSGRMVKKGATTTDGLMKGVYLVNGKKVVLK